MSTFLFVPIAQNQAQFYLQLAKELKTLGHDCHILNFHEKSDELFMSEGISYSSFFKEKRKLADDYSEKNLIQLLDKLKIENLNVLISHEKVNFKISKTEDLYRKFYSYLKTTNNIFETKLINIQDLTVVQELGGFSSCLSVYLAAKHFKIEHLFIEPSFFRGRVFFVRNSLKSILIHSNSTSVSEVVNSYLSKAIRNAQIVIPEKDKHHYESVFKKFFNINNLRRLYEKIWEKYVLKYEEEFSYIYIHFEKHFKAMKNRILLKSQYQGIPKEKFIYYPLHVPADIALTIRSPQFLDQIAFIEYLSRSLPLGYFLCIKEHPAMVGAISSDLFKNVLRSNDRIILLNPGLNNFEVISKTSAVVTINSKSGAEALILGKPVMVLGDAFYSTNNQILNSNNVGNISVELQALVERKIDVQEVKNYFQDVYSSSSDGELYGMNQQNIQTFAKSVLSVFRQGEKI